MAYAPFNLTGKVALVTGGNGGIGLGMADAMAQAGAGVVIWGTNEAKNRAAETSLKAHGGKVFAQKVDVSNEGQVTHAMQEAVAKMGRIDSVFANAGIGNAARSFVEMTTEQYRKVLAVNLDGVFFTMREAARHMRDRASRGDKGGTLVGVASLAAIEGAARNEHYAATKAAINALVRALAVELARQGVTANAILPGWIKSEMTAGLMANEKFVANVMPRIPMRRFGEPSDFGGIAVYLMSKASSYHTADTFVIDGGYTAF